MYDRLPLDYIGITDLFGVRIDPISGLSRFHYGIDLGWHKYQGEPVYAVNDCLVTYEGFDSSLGNFIVLEYIKDNNKIINRFFHLKERSKLKKGDLVKRKDIIGYMGTTGYSTGVHLHFEYWICPKDYKYSYADRKKYAVNPLDYCYLFKDQSYSNSSISKLKKVVGKSVNEDKTKSQVKVIKEKLNCREDSSLTSKVIGYIDYGYYDVLDVSINDGYTWYRIGDKMWIASLDDYLEIYLLDDNCEDIKKENVLLKEQVLTQKKIIEDLLKNNNKLNSFVAPKDDYYYIYLKKDESIYY